MGMGLRCWQCEQYTYHTMDMSILLFNLILRFFYSNFLSKWNSALFVLLVHTIKEAFPQQEIPSFWAS